MIALLILFTIFMVIGYCNPRFLLYLIVVPLVGTSLGGLAWGMSAMVFNQLATLAAFGLFMLGGNVVATVGAIAWNE